MSICDVCGREMHEADGCTHNMALIKIPRIKFGQESRMYSRKAPGHKICPDCNVNFGNYHHPGCDIEECPLCHGQLISCGHTWNTIREDSEGV